MNPSKPPRPTGRLGQLNKRARLTRRALGQWTPQPQVAKQEAVTRFTLEETEWRSQ